MPVCGLVVLTLLVGWLLVEVRFLRHDQAARAVEAAQQAPQPADSPRAARDIAGQIVDGQGRPIAGASVLVVLKTWPGGWFQQQDFATTSDVDGRFRLRELVPADGQFAVQVAALKEGYALASAYQLKQEAENQTVDPVTLALADASRVTLVVHDQRGRPVAGALVAPHTRRSRGGETHVVYFQACEPVQVACDHEGRIDLGCFQQGDRAEVYVQAPGDEWEPRTVEIPRDGGVIKVEVPSQRGATS